MAFEKYTRAEDVEVVTDTTPGQEKTARVGELTDQQKNDLREQISTEDQ